LGATGSVIPKAEATKGGIPAGAPAAGGAGGITFIMFMLPGGGACGGYIMGAEEKVLLGLG